MTGLSGSWNAWTASRRTNDSSKEIFALHEELWAGTYRHGGYTYFTIHEPKERLVAAALFVSTDPASVERTIGHYRPRQRPAPFVSTDPASVERTIGHYAPGAHGARSTRCWGRP